MKILPWIICFCLLIETGIFAGSPAKIFLYSRVDMTGTTLSLGDIASIDAEEETRKKIASLTLSASSLEDSYIDKSEIILLVREMSGEPVIVYGSAVRISRRELSEDPVESENLPVVNKGETVRVIYSSRGITIEMKGTALEKGKTGECIGVRVKDRTMNARIIDRFTVKKEQ